MDADLDGASVKISHLLNESVTVTRPTRTATGTQGGQTLSLVAIGGLHVRIRPASVREQAVQGGREESTVTHIGYTEPGASVLRDDEWTRPGGAILTVVGVRDPSKPGSHREVDLVETRQGV